MKPRPCARACKRRCRYSRLMNPRSPARCAFAIRASSLVTSVSARCNAALCSTRLIRNAAAAAATVYAPCSGSSASPNCLWPSSTVGLQRQSRKRIAMRGRPVTDPDLDQSRSPFKGPLPLGTTRYRRVKNRKHRPAIPLAARAVSAKTRHCSPCRRAAKGLLRGKVERAPRPRG